MNENVLAGFSVWRLKLRAIKAQAGSSVLGKCAKGAVNILKRKLSRVGWARVVLGQAKSQECNKVILLHVEIHLKGTIWSDWIGDCNKKYIYE